jgi:hypothetical protein|tara:strand:+ start:362 stop:514 length:153 start_codon:yes stop_codon:yes gene_type:complete
MSTEDYDQDMFVKNNQISIELMSSDDFDISKITDLITSKKISWSYDEVDE